MEFGSAENRFPKDPGSECPRRRKQLGRVRVPRLNSIRATFGHSLTRLSQVKETQKD